jgi:hypothetical protein
MLNINIVFASAGGVLKRLVFLALIIMLNKQKIPLLLANVSVII